ncbi:MAG: recombination-associated protein RdgC [Desulfobulbaceae bacterium]|uniref:Recombination-associated protein RdgC n=1 Tax=Candidatus Desulfobia pelagia TaxID=2841692 RepID=A0A8J6NGG3_9BACT|nr:recombination-associated protein RdgC [Candidatus Desulfobia pelagia]
MGLFSGSASFVRYKVIDELPENFWDFAAEKIAQHAFRDIDENYEERSVGWVSVVNMFDASFEYASFAAGDYIVLTLRIDERKVAPRVLKKFCLKEEERFKKAKQIPKLSRVQKLDIKENVNLMLLKKAVPVPSTYDLCWNLAESTLLFFSTSEKAQVELEDFFKETFGLSLMQQIPYLTAEHLVGPAKHEALSEITPAIFI